jgi:hypothetical protein
MEQRSTEWMAARCGQITASGFHKLLGDPRTKKAKEAGELTETAKSYLYEKLAERMTGEVREFSSRACDWGNEWEAAARECCAKREGWTVVTPVGAGAYVSRMPWIGASPDGYVYDDGLVEIQCPYDPANSVKTRVEGWRASGKEAQIQGQLWVTERKWCLFVSYDPRFAKCGEDPYYRELVERDEEFIETLERKVLAFRAKYHEAYQQITGVPF